MVFEVDCRRLWSIVYTVWGKINLWYVLCDHGPFARAYAKTNFLYEIRNIVH